MHNSLLCGLFGFLIIFLTPSSSFADIQTAVMNLQKTLLPETIQFYKSDDYQSVWFKGGNLNEAGKKAIEVLKNAHLEGLNPEDYQKAFTVEQETDKAQADIILTNEVIRFINHIRVGRVPPSQNSGIIKIKSPKTTPVTLLHDAIQDPKKLGEMAPDLQEYKALKHILAFYLNLLEKDGELPKLQGEAKLEKGMKKPEIHHLKKILFRLGDLAQMNEVDEFDQDVEEALKNFQERHLLEPDGVVGPNTRKMLNLSLEERIHKIIINMERLRWLPDDLGTKYIQVNVGGFEAIAVKNGHIDYRIKAIVGKTSTMTPLFYAPLKNIIINPSWHIPPGIMMRDKLHKIIEDPSYIYRAGFTVRDSFGNSVDPYQVDWESEGMHYQVSQPPGPRNALGRIKLNIDNPYIIYLHGTPEDKLFNNTIRGFSSGCIRLQQPVDLAAWVLADESDWTIEKINSSIDAGGTKTIPLKNKIPVYFTYQTVWLNEKGTVYFSNDLYQFDTTLMKLLHLKENTLYVKKNGVSKGIQNS
jgi:L,D-transpeptidase YcbB